MVTQSQPMVTQSYILSNVLLCLLWSLPDTGIDPLANPAMEMKHGELLRLLLLLLLLLLLCDLAGCCILSFDSNKLMLRCRACLCVRWLL
jgi:hypothetical protein